MRFTALFVVVLLMLTAGCGGGGGGVSATTQPTGTPTPVANSTFAGSYSGYFTRSTTTPGAVKLTNALLSIASNGTISGTGLDDGGYEITGNIDSAGNATIYWKGVGGWYTHKGFLTASADHHLTGTLKEYGTNGGAYIDEASYIFLKE